NVAVDFAMIAVGGDVVVYGSGQPDIAVPFVPAILKNVNIAFFIVYNLSPEDRKRAVVGLTALLERGALQHNIAARLPLARIAEAHEMVESGSATGNVVVEVQPLLP
ncbi:MAG: zinc-binding dehydrogenase, partial [Arenimonas sp.]